MLALGFPPPDRVDGDHLASVRRIVAQVLDTQRRSGNRAANQAIIDAIGVIAVLTRNEDYYGEALDYHLGLLYAHLGEADLAAHHIERSGTHPGGGGNHLFPDHQNESMELRQRQELAKDRSLPSILIASMPRSASASLTQTLGAVLDMPIMRASCGRFPEFILIPRWFNSASSGGAILHDHFGASIYNLRMLRERGVHELFVGSATRERPLAR